MANSEQKPAVLSDDMKKLKRSIQDKIHKEDLLEEVHKKSRLIDTISNGAANLYSVVAVFLSSIAAIPIIGYSVKMFAVIPGAIATLTDSKKSIGEKAFAMGILFTVVALSTAAFAVVVAAVGATAAAIATAAVQAAIIGTTVASLITALEIFKIIGLSIEKHRAKTALNDKIEFEEALKNKALPDGDKFNAELEIRAVELVRKKTSPGLSEEETKEIEDKLQFIKQELSKRNITIGDNKEGSAHKLQELYAKRDEKLLEMAPFINAIQSAPEGTDLTETFDKLRALQEELVTIDNDIEEITQPLEKVARRNGEANENLAQAVTILSMALLGLVMSVAGYLVAAGTLGTAALPILGGFGIGMTFFSLVTFGAFKANEHKKIIAEEAKLEIHKDNILDEALDCYEKNQAQISAGLSTGKILDGLGNKSGTPPVQTPVSASVLQVNTAPDQTPVPVKAVEPPVATVEKKADENAHVSSSSLI